MEALHHGENKNETLDTAFDAAIDDIKSLRFSPDFQAYCAEQNIKESPRSLEYWAAVAEFQQTTIDTESDPMLAHIQTIVAATPDAILRNTMLDEQQFEYKEAHEHKKVLSHYNALIRDFADSYPDTSVSGMIANLNNTALATVAESSRHMQRSSQKLTRAIVRGAQHEAAFGALLQHTGFPYRPATIEEDLRGMDYVVEIPELKDPIGIDVKASLSKIEAKNHDTDDNELFAFSPENNLILWSMVTDAELADRFTVPPELIEERTAPVMAGLFQAGNRKAA